METCFSYTNDVCYMSSDERKWINRIQRLAEERPDEVRILASPENNDGCIYATLPAKWVQARPPRVCTLTDEQKEASAQRLKAYRMSQT